MSKRSITGAFKTCLSSGYRRLIPDTLKPLVHESVRLIKGEKVVFKNRGFCPTCAKNVTFVATNTWLRDYYRCSRCGSKPRERALMRVLEMYYPDWRNRVIHESSPISRGASIRIAQECKTYIPSQLFSDIVPGEFKEGTRCENLEAMTFADKSIDLHITQDVMEHVLDPALVFKEVARTLKPGGAHIFTVPIVNKHNPSDRRALLKDGRIVYLREPVYHGNPVNDNGALVTFDWGFDICEHIFKASGLYTHIVNMDDVSHGIRAEYIEVLVTIKPQKAD